jgi:hypothetical protein
MILKKMINSKISPFEKPKYIELFHKIIEEISKGKISKFETYKSPYFKSEGNKSENLWHIMMKSVDEKDETFMKSKIVFSYLLKKARIKYQEILNFSKEQGLSSEDVVKIVRTNLIF